MSPGKTPAPRARLWALLMVAAAGLYGAVAIGLADPATVGQAAAPWPDGAEYLDGAVSLARDGRFAIHVAGEEHPSRFPFGYSLLTATALALGAETAAAPHLVNLAAGLGLVALVTAWLWRRRGEVEAGGAALLLVSLPAFVVLCRSPLSDVAGTLLVVGSIFLLFDYAGSGSPGRAALAGLLLGVSLWFRTSHALLLGFVPAALVARHGADWRAACRDALPVGLATALGLAPLWAYNAITFGSPLATGYDHWVPFWSPSRAFQWQFVDDNLLYYWREFTQRESRTTTATLYGQGSYFGPAFVVLALLAPFAEPRGRRFWCFSAAGIAYALVMTAYFYSDARLLFPLLVLAAPIVATSVVALCRSRRAPAGLVALPLLLAALLGWPGPGDGGPATVAFVQPSPRVPTAAYRVTQRLQRLRGPDSRLVLTDLAPPYLHALTPPGTLVAPLFDDHGYRFSPRALVFERSERRRLVADALAGGRSVWVVTHRHDILGVEDAFPPPAGHAWEIVAREDPDGSGIGRLVPE